MPRVFDNIETSLLSALQQSICLTERGDFCVGYFNLRGWKQLHDYIDRWPGGDGNCCRLLVGMIRTPREELERALSVTADSDGLDQQSAARYRARLAREFRDQLMVGVPTDADELGLRKLAEQIRHKKVVVRLYLKHTLHAKLYLLFRPDPQNPIIGYLGSSNLTLSGLSQQGELNVDVVDLDACEKLARWFDDRWNDRWCLDISEDLLQVIDESWARETPIPPYHIYVKMAYHLSQEARSGLAEFRIPRDFGNRLFPFQSAAVQIAAHHLNRRNGVLIGDVVGLGKTLMATALARIFEDDHGLETLIICPKNLTPMWEEYRKLYHLRATVMSISQVQTKLPREVRHRILVIDESHNLRNREGKRYKAIQAYIEKNDCKVILLTATPYNKTYLDLSSQLRLFVPPDQDLGVRPEQWIKQHKESELLRLQVQPRTLAAFEKSEYPDDWRELMRLYLVRRTRSFVKDNYASLDPANGRKYLEFSDGTRSYFPDRIPRTAKFSINEKDPQDQYARMYHSDVVKVINTLNLSRYGLGNYQQSAPDQLPTLAEVEVLSDLGRAGNRLIGFCRTNLFKRLESSGKAFIMSVERHILRNYIFLHAIENDLPLPVGAQDNDLLDTRFTDEDRDLIEPDDDNGDDIEPTATLINNTEQAFQAAAARVYAVYRTDFKKRFKWLRSSLFGTRLAEHLHEDADALINILHRLGPWDPARDAKLNSLHQLLTQTHATDKVLIFSQFADTVRYLHQELQNRGLDKIAGVTGSSSNPTMLAWHFSPVANEKRDYIPPKDELRILVTTDILSEGQNLQDAHVVVNYDLPWAIIRLIQRAGRVDRIGQKSERILCYSFLPAEGVERVINLRGRVRQRLQENAEVVGADEAFFEDDNDERTIVDLYNENSGILDGDDDSEIDLASYAHNIWRKAVEDDASLKKIIENMPDVVFSTKLQKPTVTEPEGVLAYIRTSQGNDLLAWMDRSGKSITESQLAILRAAECRPDTPALPRHADHHNLVETAVNLALKETPTAGGQLGRPSGARFRTYERLKNYVERVQSELFNTTEMRRVVEEVYKYPLRQTAIDSLNRQLKAGINDFALAELCITLRKEGRLCQIIEEAETQEPRIICSMGLTSGE